MPSAAERKVDGIHYTPVELADFLAAQVVTPFLLANSNPRVIRVVDPACGDGALLDAVVRLIPAELHARIQIRGFDTSESAVAAAAARLRRHGVSEVTIARHDFLDWTLDRQSVGQLALNLAETPSSREAIADIADIVISNPPYVRTQILGAKQARLLAARFDLTGRVDLYHAFVVAMTHVLRAGGFLGLLTSNRFLTTQAGATLRQWLSQKYDLSALYDLGDTKFFEAAVLPAVAIAQKRSAPNASAQESACAFLRVYEATADHGTPVCDSILEALEKRRAGSTIVQGRCFNVEIGTLRREKDPSVPWILTNTATERWIKTIELRQKGVFDTLGNVCVGIKTTADKVFIRDDWESLPEHMQPEPALLHMLVTHHAAQRWTLEDQACGNRRVLYPYTLAEGRRTPIDLESFPRAAAYLTAHRDRLSGRTYVLESGREWFEIWVPHHPADWARPKIAFPDISSANTFFLVNPGCIVNGDCYWIAPDATAPDYALHAMLAVANSSFITRYYDVVFHNKLYAGRRRFMCQYVRRFPLPDASSCRELAAMVAELLAEERPAPRRAKEVALDARVWQSFGLSKEV